MENGIKVMELSDIVVGIEVESFVIGWKASR